MADLEQVITDSVNDSINDVVEETPDIAEDASSEPVEAPVDDAEPGPVAEEGSSTEVPSPANVAASEATPAEPQDEFSKLAGMPQMGVGGRENRIPYSRVKKITEKAVNDVAEAALGRKLAAGEKAVDVVKTHVARIPDLEAKVTDYEARLTNVGQFENVMANDPERFLTMLAKLPAYKGFFDFVEQGSQALRGQPGQPNPEAAAVPQGDGMPEPDEELSDGSKVYSMEGLKALLAWNAQHVETKLTSGYEAKLKAIEDRYTPMATEWNERRRIEATLPVIRKQLEDARTWPLFNESEGEILEVLKADGQISLEGAYRKVVFPKLVAERNNVRQDVIKEIKAAPVATSVASRVVSKPTTSPSGGPRSLEDVIKEQIASIK